MTSRRWQTLILMTMAAIGVGFGIYLLRKGFPVLGCLCLCVFLWRGQEFAVWFITPEKAPSDVTPPLTARGQRLLLAIVCFLGAAVCAVGAHLWWLWPEQWQAGLVFILSGLLVLAPVTVKQIQSRRGTVSQPTV